ncbi:unnamed protein product [Cuscuta europaea]|uniref:Uncharacterized protein n=1 Tax=Cuscuta europaea TaxID=41803 RepID=A0A9P0YS67_CUSEU|nr:unnamed protein product [Cuscuta europaea]
MDFQVTQDAETIGFDSLDVEFLRMPIVSAGCTSEWIQGVNICIWTEIASDAVTLRRRCHLLQFIANISSSHESELVIDSGLPSHRQPESKESGTRLQEEDEDQKN